MSNSKAEGKKYKLLNFIISVENDVITAFEYMYFLKEDSVREFIYPARIDPDRDMLVIDINISLGKDSGFLVNKISKILSGLPSWDHTKYYRIAGAGRDDMYLSSCNIVVKHSKLPIQIIK